MSTNYLKIKIADFSNEINNLSEGQLENNELFKAESPVNQTVSSFDLSSVSSLENFSNSEGNLSSEVSSVSSVSSD